MRLAKAPAWPSQRVRCSAVELITGPSDKVTALAKGADMLVAELIDIDATIANLRRRAREEGWTRAALLPSPTGRGERIDKNLSPSF